MKEDKDIMRKWISGLKKNLKYDKKYVVIGYSKIESRYYGMIFNRSTQDYNINPVFVSVISHEYFAHYNYLPSNVKAFKHEKMCCGGELKELYKYINEVTRQDLWNACKEWVEKLKKIPITKKLDIEWKVYRLNSKNCPVCIDNDKLYDEYNKHNSVSFTEKK